MEVWELPGQFAWWLPAGTTANPTMYRAGLAIQAVLPALKRWKVTLIIGIVVTLLACFPGVVTKLMSFIAFYALLAVPVGAVVFADIYFIPKLGIDNKTMPNFQALHLAGLSQ
jgi:cytosine permease